MDHLGAIRAFVSVVQRGGFSAAANAENTSQATVSKRLAALEDHLGVQLMRRTSREAIPAVANSASPSSPACV